MNYLSRFSRTRPVRFLSSNGATRWLVLAHRDQFVQALLKDEQAQLPSIAPTAPPKASEDSSEAPLAMVCPFHRHVDPVLTLFQVPWVFAPHKVGDSRDDVGKVVKFS